MKEMISIARRRILLAALAAAALAGCAEPGHTGHFKRDSHERSKYPDAVPLASRDIVSFEADFVHNAVYGARNTEGKALLINRELTDRRPRGTYSLRMLKTEKGSRAECSALLRDGRKAEFSADGTDKDLQRLAAFILDHRIYLTGGVHEEKEDTSGVTWRIRAEYANGDILSGDGKGSGTCPADLAELIDFFSGLARSRGKAFIPEPAK